MHEKAIKNALRVLADYDPTGGPPATLPLLRAYRKRFPTPGAFKDCTVLFIQHLLGPTMPRLDAMWEEGLEKDRTFFVDIPYSTHTPLRDALVRKGVPEDQVARPFEDPLDSYSIRQAQRVRDAIRAIATKCPSGTLLVVDDGAYFTRVMHAFSIVDPGLFESFRGRTRVVEQTSRGHRHLEDPKYMHTLAQLDAPIVSIARCDTKTEVEGPFIGQAIAKSIWRILSGIRKERGGYCKWYCSEN